jgi:phosphoglucosamine mutase
MGAKLFGTDGVRGVANREPMTPQTVLRLGFAGGAFLRSKSAPGQRVTCVIGRDTRQSGEMIEGALAAGLASAGIDVLRAGVVPTPAVAFLTRHLKAGGGAVVSASHNPYEDNGIKFFGPDAGKLPDGDEAQIEARMDALANGEMARSQSGMTGPAVGTAHRLPEAVDLYCAQVKRVAFGDATAPLKGLKIVVDCANGASVTTSPRVLAELGAEVIAIHDQPDGKNINAGCGSLHITEVQRAVLAHRAQVGISHDGDADRVLMCDERGQLVDGDFILGITGRFLKARGELPGDALVTTVMANLGLELALKKLGIRVLKTKVGDRYVKEMMDAEGIVLGGEQSGHVIFSRLAPTGDGLLTALEVLKVIVAEGKPFSELHSFLSTFPQVLLNVRVREKVDLATIPGLSDVVRQVEAALGEEGRVVLRYSGTEPLARVMVEGPTEAVVRAHAELVARTIRERIGAEE